MQVSSSWLVNKAVKDKPKEITQLYILEVDLLAYNYIPK